MSTSSPNPDSSTDTSNDTSNDEVVDWTDLGAKMWIFLTGRDAAINYRFIDMSVEVPRDTGSNAPRATWKLDGTLRVTTDDNASAADGSHRGV